MHEDRVPVLQQRAAVGRDVHGPDGEPAPGLGELRGDDRVAGPERLEPVAGRDRGSVLDARPGRQIVQGLGFEGAVEGHLNLARTARPGEDRLRQRGLGVGQLEKFAVALGSAPPVRRAAVRGDDEGAAEAAGGACDEPCLFHVVNETPFF